VDNDDIRRRYIRSILALHYGSAIPCAVEDLLNLSNNREGYVTHLKLWLLDTWDRIFHDRGPRRD